MAQGPPNDEPKASAKQLWATGLLGVLFIAEVVFIFYTLITFFPAAAATTTDTTTVVTAATAVSIKYFWWTISMSPEIQLLLLVIISGALGSEVYLMNEFWRSISNYKFRLSDISGYILKPFIGAAFALVFYCVVRGGFLSFSGKDSSQINPYGFAAVSAMVGIFTKNVMAKLKQLFDALLSSDTEKSTSKNGDQFGDKKQLESKGVAGGKKQSSSKDEIEDMYL